MSTPRRAAREASGAPVRRDRGFRDCSTPERSARGFGFSSRFRRARERIGAGIRAFIDRHNQNSKPFERPETADDILASVEHFCHRADRTLCGEL